MKYQIEAKSYGAYDVVVCGGGTAGCMAAIAAAREGANTLLIERSFVVGGMLTVGEAGITKFSEHCKDVDRYKKEVIDVLASDPKSVQVAGGIAHEYVMRMISDGKAVGTHGDAGSYVFTDKAESQWVLMQMLEEAGVEVMYDTRVCLVKKDEDKVCGVVVCNKEGFLEIEAKQTIDTTGDADVAALAGVPFNKGAVESDVNEGCAKRVGEMQGIGCMYRVKGVDFEKLFAHLKADPTFFHQHEFGPMSLDDVMESYARGDMCVFRVHLKECSPSLKSDLVQIYNLPAKDEAILLGPGCGYLGDGLDARSLSTAHFKIHKGAHELTEAMKRYPGFENAEVLYVPDAGVRETRHIIGEHVLSVIDVLSGKDFEDSIACGGHPLDIHPLPPEVENVDLNHWRFHIPYGVLLPKNTENLLVAGRAISATRGASGATRPTVQCMAMGEAVGVAAAMAAQSGMTPKQIDVQVLRRRLVEKGCII